MNKDFKKEVKMIVNNAKNALDSNGKVRDVSLYELKLKHTPNGGMNKDFPDLVIYGNSEYPTSPVYHDKTGFFKEVFLHDVMKNDRLLCVYRSVVIGQMESVLYNLYKSKIMRASKTTKEFARWIIHLSLLIGCDGTVVSIPEFSLSKFNIKKQAARDLLKKLHDAGIIIFLAGTGLPLDAERGSVPMGFMLHPDHENTIQEKLEALRTKKITMLDIKEI